MREMGGRVYLKVACLGLHVERRDKPSQVLPWCLLHPREACMPGLQGCLMGILSLLFMSSSCDPCDLHTRKVYGSTLLSSALFLVHLSNEAVS